MFYFEGKPCSALFIACYREAYDIAEILIANGANINALDNSGETPLHKASVKGHLDIFKLLIKNEANVNAVNINNQTPLFEASRCHQFLVVDLLLSHNATVNITDNQGWTPLLRAFQKSGGDRTVKALVLRGANVNVKNFNEESPLHLAVAQNNIDIVRLLLDHGAKESLN
ncbi:ankyrin repeat-containing protein [Xenococcus sp. PCC 7305]|uniref:ankyrin repeat domain-containing protein n=1 Tax=Xenococcus sp. PCC 7305 TaxID=102125 RepID=UPI0002AC6FDC|nr:ankyrin repeat domain-containing protein [Xenococcus sp. PCC 7305]ELS01711.1 ankyrin repeat-containing protein [Xenococcus sp. PCC 7305]